MWIQSRSELNTHIFAFVVIALTKYVLGVIGKPIEISLMSLKRKALAGLLFFDAVIAIWISISNGNYDTLQVWLWLNLIVVAFSLAIFIGLKLRSRCLVRHRASSKNTYSHSLKSHTEHNYNPQVTLDGEVVKSGGERLIANYFHEHDIKYEYEKPAKDLSNRRISKPDFYLPEYDTYVEYWGMVNAVDHRKRQQYIEGMHWKIARYHENGLKFISIFPEDLRDLDTIFKHQLE